MRTPNQQPRRYVLCDSQSWKASSATRSDILRIQSELFFNSSRVRFCVALFGLIVISQEFELKYLFPRPTANFKN